MSDQDFVKEIEKFDKNLKSLVNECLENDLSEEKIYRLINKNVCRKVSRNINKINRTKNAFTFLKIFIITFALSYLMTRNQLTTDLLKMIGRKILINIQPIYDWTEHYDTNCLISKNQVDGPQANIVNCNLCENVKKCEIITNSNDLDKLTFLIINQRPIKISNKLSVEFLLPNRIFDLTLEKLADFYLNLTYEDKVCMFESNLNFDDVFNLMSQVEKTKFESKSLPFFAHWENCGYLLRKKVRMLYDIPDQMPMMLEFSRNNWFMLSINNYQSDNYKMIDIASGTKLAFLIQIHGSNKIRLKPKENCSEFGCTKLEEVIKEKDLLIFSTALFDFEYLPTKENNLNLALLLGAIY